MKSDPQQMVVLRGIVTASSWDTEGQVTGIQISGPGEEEYVLENEGSVQALMRHIREEIEVSGFLVDYPTGKRGIKV
ncbi:MAG: hypothetical protein GTO00_13020, partial [Deltaproteobacteria bacterium]|nr:hypothetical protein [Deltaproteobacteria bacterium]